MDRRLRNKKPKGFYSKLQKLLCIEDRKRLFAFAAIAGFVLVYTLFTASQQVNPTNWSYTELYEEGWMNPEHTIKNWQKIDLPQIDMGKTSPAYYRGAIELTGAIKPDIEIGLWGRILEVYVNGEQIKDYICQDKGLEQKVVLKSSLFNPGKNTLAVKLEGITHRSLGIGVKKPEALWPIRLRGLITPQATENNSIATILLFTTPLLIFLILGRKSLDSNKTALIVFSILALVFAAPIFKDFNYWGAFDWDLIESLNAVPRATILNFHQIPLWDPYVSGGLPMLAEPQSTFLSPIFAVILLFDVITGMKMQIILGYLIGLFGIYLTGKELKMNTYSRYLAAFAFMFSSMYSLHLAGGHTSFSCIFLLPWAFFFYIKTLADKNYALPGAIVFSFMLFGGGLYTLIYTGMLLFLYSVFCSIQKLIEKRPVIEIINPLITIMVIVMLCSALSAIKALPMVELSMKYSRTTTDFTGPPTVGYSLTNLYYAFLGTNQLRYNPDVNHSGWDNMGAYIGPIAFILSIFGILLCFRKQWPLVLVIAFGVLICFGSEKSEMLLWNALQKLPVFSSFGWVSRFLVIALFPICLFAGYMCSKIEEKKPLIAMIIAVAIFYNLLIVDSPALTQSFTIPPRAIEKTIFVQVVDYPEMLFVYGESYKHFLQNQGIINFYGSIMGLSRAQPAINTVYNQGYKGEAYMESGEGIAVIKSFTPNRLRISVKADINDTLIINQNYNTGWRALGKEAYEKNGLIAVNVTQQDNEILLYYSPKSFKIGLFITLATIFLLLKYFKLKKEKRNLRNYAKKEYKKTALYLILIAIGSTYGVDIVQILGI